MNVRDRFLCFLNGCYHFGSLEEIVRNYARWKQRNRVLTLMSRSLQSSTRPFAGFSFALYFPCPPVPIAFTSFPQVFDVGKTTKALEAFPDCLVHCYIHLWLFRTASFSSLRFSYAHSSFAGHQRRCTRSRSTSRCRTFGVTTQKLIVCWVLAFGSAVHPMK